jgi:uncharacterized protein GlcG (DUF336 family)
MGDVVEVRTISFTAARKALDAAVAEAETIGLPVCIAVCGASGDERLFARMDGAPELSASIARDKAWTVTAFGGTPTHQWWSIIGDDPSLVHGITKIDRLIVFGGGVPITVGGTLVGAVGVSGGRADDDRRIAEAGASAVAG